MAKLIDRIDGQDTQNLAQALPGRDQPDTMGLPQCSHGFRLICSQCISPMVPCPPSRSNAVYFIYLPSLKLPSPLLFDRSGRLLVVLGKGGHTYHR